MSKANRQRLDEALELVRDSLSSYFQKLITVQYGKQTWSEAVASSGRGRPLGSTIDIQQLTNIFFDYREDCFNVEMGQVGVHAMHALKTIRNKHAHQQPFSSRETLAALYSIQELLTIVGEPEQVARLQELDLQIMGEILAEQQRAHSVKVTPTQVQSHVPRRNLFYSTKICVDRDAKKTILVDLLAEKFQGTGVVYVNDRQDAEEIAALLKYRSIEVFSNRPQVATPPPFSSSPPEHHHIKLKGSVGRVIIALMPSSIEIYHPNIRFTIHLSPPTSIEAYVRDSGVAGRDGGQSSCILLATNAELDLIYQEAAQGGPNLDSLRDIYKSVRASHRGQWAIISPESIPTPSMAKNPNGNIDLKAALGIFEQAGLITQHPDAPAKYDIHRSSGRLESEALPEALYDYRRWLATLVLPAEIDTAEICSKLGISPSELYQLLSVTPKVSARGLDQEIAVQFLPSPGVGKNETKSRIDRLLLERQEEEFLRVKEMVDYIEDRSDECRHSILAPYFGGVVESCHTACDVCTGTADRHRKGMVSEPRAIPKAFAQTAKDLARSH